MSRVDELAGLLQQERRDLEFLLYKLVAARQLLRAGETRFLGWSSAEVERAAERVRETELLRATFVVQVADELALGETEPSLQRLASSTDEPLRSILDDHRLALRSLLGEIDQVQATNRALASDGVRLVRDVVDLLESAIGSDEDDADGIPA
jgi:hypothetical protein